jgi:hypothetical protein
MGTALAIPQDEEALWGAFGRPKDLPHLGGKDTPRLKFSGDENKYWPSDDPGENLMGEQMLPDLYWLHYGFTEWSGGKPVAHHIVRAPHPMPSRKSLGKLDENEWPTKGGKPVDPMEEGQFLPMLSLQGLPYVFITTSKSGFREIRNLATLYMGDKQKILTRLPIITLTSERFETRFGGKKWAPIFEVVNWVTVERDAEGRIDGLPEIKKSKKSKAEVIPPKKTKGKTAEADDDVGEAPWTDELEEVRSKKSKERKKLGVKEVRTSGKAFDDEEDD